MSENWVKMKFKDVPLNTEFGFGDYFHYKVTDTTAVCDVNSEVYPWDLNLEVFVEDVSE